MIYPFIDLQNYYDNLDFTANPQYAQPDPTKNNQSVTRQEFDLFRCPSDPLHGLTTPWGARRQLQPGGTG